MEEKAMSEERWRSEQQFHDRQAAQRRRALRADDYRFSDETYLDHESWIRPALDALGDVHGLRVLDLGCGHGMASVVLARRGATVTACDLSPGYLHEARTRALANDVPTHLLVCNGERLPFADASFERIWGNAILHHLDLQPSVREIARVLAPKGIAVFCEPWGGNRWLQWVRRHASYPRKQRTLEETPLHAQDLDQLRHLFPRMRVQGYQLLSMLGRIIKQDCLVAALTSCDTVVLRYLPRWQKYCRYVVVVLAKEA